MTVTITPRTDMNPVPRVELVINKVDVPAATTRLTVWRVSDGREYKVRDAIDRTIVTAVSFVDVEPARGTVSVYEAECWSATNAYLGRVALGSTTVAWVGDRNTVVIQQPLDAELSVEVQKLVGSWPELTRETPGDLVFTEGASLPIYVGFGPRRGYQGVAVEFAVSSRAQAAALHETLGDHGTPQLPIWLIRGDGTFLPRIFFGRVKALTEIDFDVSLGDEWSTFRAVLDEVTPPAPALLNSVLSYDDLDAGYASYTTMDAAYASYDAKDRDYSLAGLAP